MIILEFNFLSNSLNVKNAISKSTSFIFNNIPYLTKEEQYDFKLIFTELLGNSFLHGNKCNINKKINVLIELDNSFVSAVITDEGLGFNLDYFLDELHYIISLDAENNRGLYIVKTLTDSLTFDNSSVKFIKSVTSYE